MTETSNRYGIYKVDHTKFGGEINLSDFATDHRGKNNYSGSIIAKRIVGDKQFDKQCRKYIEARERNKQYGK